MNNSLEKLFLFNFYMFVLFVSPYSMKLRNKAVARGDCRVWTQESLFYKVENTTCL